jgi:transcriptional regulator with XRE-family HTH domain
MQPNSERSFPYPLATDFGEGLGQVDSKHVLWNSVSSLMQKHYGEENLSRLARECKIGPASASRIKEAKTSVGLEIIDKIAKHFQVQTWELLVPAFDPSNRPTLQPVSEQERRLYERLREVAKEIKEAE